MYFRYATCSFSRLVSSASCLGLTSNCATSGILHTSVSCSGSLNMKLSTWICPREASSALFISSKHTGSGSLNLNTSYCCSGTRLFGAASSDSDKSLNSISGLGVLGSEVSEEDMSYPLEAPLALSLTRKLL